MKSTHTRITCRIIALIIISMLSLPIPIAFAQEQNYMQIKSESKVETLPGELVISMLHISNPETHRKSFDLEIECPDGWNVISGEGLIEIDPGTGIQRLASFLPPKRERAGEYPVSFILRLSDSSLLEKQTISVAILPLPEIQLSNLASLQRNAIAGDTVNFEFNLSNAGNVPVDVTLDAHMSMGEVKPASTEEKINLDVGESRIISIEATLDRDFNVLTGVPLILIAHVFLNGKIVETATKDATSKVQVYPGGSDGSDEFNNLPGKIKLKGIIEDREETRSDLQAEISLDGSLRDDKSDDFSLLYRGPAPDNPNPVYSLDEEFHVSYDDGNTGIYLGDGYYDLSPLIENSGRGRGIELTNEFESFNLRTFLSHSSRNLSDESIIGVDVGFPIDENNEISMLYFNSDVRKSAFSQIDDRSIWGFRGELGNSDNLDFDIEFAQGGENNVNGRDYAYQVKGTYRENGFEIGINRLFAGPGFGGYYRDMNFSEINTSVPLGNGFKFRGNWRNQQRNYNREDDLFSSFRDKNIMAGFGYSGKHGVSLTADYIDKYRADIIDPLFDNNQRFWRLGASREFGDLFLTARIEIGENEDRISNQTVNHLSQYGSFSWKVDENLALFGFVNWSEGDSFNIQKGKSTRSGFHFNYSPGNDMFLTAGLNFDLVSDSFKRFYIPLTLKYRFKNGDQIEVRARYSLTERNGVERDDAAVMVEYSVPISFKIGRKAGVSTLTGHIIDNITGEPMKGVLIHTGNLADVTDENGEYSIYGLTPGEQTISVNLTNLGYRQITIPESPVTVDLPEGVTNMEFRVMTGGCITGHVLVTSGTDDTEPYGLENIFIELKSDAGSEYRLTDENGGFVFELLPPGHYSVIIDDSNLPEYHHLEKREYSFDLTPGIEIDFDANVVVDIVKVRIIKEEELSVRK